MNVIVFGANGGTGRQVVEQGLAAGHAITAVVRRPDALALHHERLRLVCGDVLQTNTITEPVRDQDAVISALGTRGRAPAALCFGERARSWPTSSTPGRQADPVAAVSLDLH